MEPGSTRTSISSMLHPVPQMFIDRCTPLQVHLRYIRTSLETRSIGDHALYLQAVYSIITVLEFLLNQRQQTEVQNILLPMEERSHSIECRPAQHISVLWQLDPEVYRPLAVTVEEV